MGVKMIEEKNSFNLKRMVVKELNLNNMKKEINRPDAATGTTTAENILGNKMYGGTISNGEITVGGEKVAYIHISSPVEAVRNINSFFKLFDWVNQYYYYEYSRMCDVAKIYGEESFDLNPCFTFAIDMLTQLWDRNPEKGLESYIKRMVKQYCKKEIQGYFEMALSLSIMVEVFTYKNIPELCEVCKKWYNDLLYSEEYKNYVSKDQNLNVRCILN